MQRNMIFVLLTFLGFANPNTLFAQWRTNEPFYANSVHALAVNGGYVFAGTDVGLFVRLTTEQTGLRQG